MSVSSGRWSNRDKQQPSVSLCPFIDPDRHSSISVLRTRQGGGCIVKGQPLDLAAESRQMTLAYGSMPLFFLGHGEGRPFSLRTNLQTSEAKAARHTTPDAVNCRKSMSASHHAEPVGRSSACPV
jgi:hypothetical protein